MHQPGVFLEGGAWGFGWGIPSAAKLFFFRSEKELAKTARVLQASKIAFAFLYNFSPFSSRMYALYNGVYTFVRMCVAGVWVLYIYFGHYMQFCGTTYALFVVRFCFCARMRHTSCVRKVLPLLLFGFCFLFFPFSVREFVLLMQYL